MADAQVFVGAGDLYINRVDPATGLSAGMAGLFYVDKSSVKANTTIREKESKGRSPCGQVIGSVACRSLEITQPL